jgi:hypothetical protein
MSWPVHCPQLQPQLQPQPLPSLLARRIQSGKQDFCNGRDRGCLNLPRLVRRTNVRRSYVAVETKRATAAEMCLEMQESPTF